jgi:hypothetical protein
MASENLFGIFKCFLETFFSTLFTIYFINRKYEDIFLMAYFKIVAIFLFFYLNMKNNCFFFGIIYT